MNKKSELQRCKENLKKIRIIKEEMWCIFGFTHTQFRAIIDRIEKGEKYTLKRIELIKQGKPLKDYQQDDLREYKK